MTISAMHLLRQSPPEWAGAYLTIPFKDRGRDASGLDCWGLVRMVYLERFGVMLDDHAATYESCTDGVGMAAAWQAERQRWTLLDSSDALRVGDVAAFRIGENTQHVGIAVARGRFLHAVHGVGVAIEDWASPLWANRLRGWYRYAGPVAVSVRRSILRDEVEQIAAPAGVSIAECAAMAGLADVPGVVALLGGTEVPRERWSHVRPRAGAVLAFGVTPTGGGGGGKTILRLVMTVAIIAGAIYTGGLLAGASWGFGFAAGTTSYAVASGVITAAVTIAGSLLLNALVPAPGNRLSENSDLKGSSSINGARNTARPFGATNVVLGRVRLAPPYAARPYTEQAGDVQYLRCVFDVGAGPLALSDLRIGDTPLSEFEGVEVEVREGYPTDAPLTLYPGVVLEDQESVQITAASGWIVRRTATDADELSVDIAFPRGLAQYGGGGDRSLAEVQLEIEYRRVGDEGAWLPVGGEPLTSRQLAFLFRAPEVEPGGTGVFNSGFLAWGFNGADGSDPNLGGDTDWSVEFDGYLYFGEQGHYDFAINANGPVELVVAGEVLVSWYGYHEADAAFGSHTGTTFLRSFFGIGRPIGGWVRITVRAAFRAGASALGVAIRGPGIPEWTSIGKETAPLRTVPSDSGGEAGVAFRWFRTDGYVFDPTIEERTSELIRRTYAWAVERGQYDVRIRRLTEDSTSDLLVNDTYWSALRTFRNRAPVAVPGRALVALRIQATGQLNGVIDEFNLVAHSIGPRWRSDLRQWVAETTSSPASAYRLVLQGAGVKRPMDDDRLDLEVIQAWSESCDALGFECNMVVDFPGTTYERLRDVCAVGRASLDVRDGRFGVVHDAPRSTPVQMFTPRNTRNLRGRVAFPDRPHAIRVGFLNRETGYSRDEVTVYADGYSRDGGNGTQAATRFEPLELFGVTSAVEAARHGRYFMAVATLRPEVLSFETDVEHIVAHRGDLVLVAHDVPQTIGACGRITALAEDSAGYLSAIGMDEFATLAAGTAYTLRVRKDDGTILAHTIKVSETAETRRLVLDPPLEPSQTWPAVGDLAVIGGAGQETRAYVVRAILPGADLSATVEVVDYAPAIFTADSEPLPPWDPGIVRPPDVLYGPAIPEVAAIQSDDFVLLRGADGTLLPRMLLTIRAGIGTREPAVAIQVQTRAMLPGGRTWYVSDGPWTSHPTAPLVAGRVYVEGVTENVRYQIRVRAIGASGRASAWQTQWTPTAPDPDAVGYAIPLEHKVVGKLRPPPDVQAFDVTRAADGTRVFTWALGPIPPDVVGVQVRFGQGGRSLAWNELTPLHTGTLEGASPWETNMPAAGSWRFAIKMVDVLGLESRNALIIDRVLGSPRQDGVVASIDAAADQWPGTRTDCYLSDDGALWAQDQFTWDNAVSWDTFTRWTLGAKNPIAYEHTPIDLGAVITCDVSAYAVADSGTTTVEIAHSQDGTTYTEWAPLSLAAATVITARFIKARVSLATVGDLIGVLRAFVVSVRAPQVEYVINDLDTSGLPADLRLADGDVRIPVPAGMFAAIRSVFITFNGTGAGMTWELVDRNASPGPRIRMYDDTFTGANPVIDVVVRGIPVQT